MTYEELLKQIDESELSVKDNLALELCLLDERYLDKTQSTLLAVLRVVVDQLP